MVWDFFANHPMATHQFLFLYSDRGIPDGFRHMHGYGSHTFKTVNDKNEFVWVKFHLRSDQGIKNLDPTKAKALAGEQPDYALSDLYNAIARKEYPSWTLYVQVVTHEQAKTLPYNPFDLTIFHYVGLGRLFSYADTHLHRVGTNHHIIPVNNPETNKNVKVCTYQRDGAMQTGHNQGSAPNYHKNSYNGPDVTNRDKHIEHATFESGMAARHS
ncbi:unnamed protein product, partial [Rotaria magnacalcarata]